MTSGDMRRLVPVLEARLPQILDEVREHFRAEWPDYAEFLVQEHDEVGAAAKAFLQRLIEIVERGESASLADGDSSSAAALFEEVGRLQWREGRELTTLLSAYQVGARVAWHHVSRAALDLGVEPNGLAALAEAVFIFIDQLSSASARGYVMEQSESAATREQLRGELVELLLSDRSDQLAVRGAATRAGWPLPRTAAVILVDPDNLIGQAVLSRLDSSCLLIRRRRVMGAIMPDPVRPGRRQRLTDALRGAGAVVGHPVALEHLPASMRIAEIAAGLQRDGVLDEDPVFAEEHLDAIIVHRDARLLAAFQARMLTPLHDLPPAARDRLTQTLASWLRHFGDRRRVAADLHVHPQTVRYRMTQLHQLFGGVLDDPAGRARLMLALAWNRPIPRPRREPASPATRRSHPHPTRDLGDLSPEIRIQTTKVQREPSGPVSSDPA
jgi:PucR C-terminal helix-turn-helix domain